MNITIITPASAQPRSGNQHTAQRWAGFLRDLGHRVTLAPEWDHTPTDVLIALHAKKSSASIARFHNAHPQRRLIVVLTGTDLYRDIASSAAARRSLQLASTLVVLQPGGLQELPENLHAKTRVIFQSAASTIRQHAPGNIFRVAVVGHLRKEKDPFRAVRALTLLRRADSKFKRSDIELLHIGKALTADMEKAAERWMEREPRYRWLGSLAHPVTMRKLAGSHLLVVSSVMEGGANVICEASRIGVPVLATRISGNVGMLGSDYNGYFKLRDQKQLAALIARAADDRAYYRELRNAISKRRHLFSPAAERRALKQLLIDRQR